MYIKYSTDKNKQLCINILQPLDSKALNINSATFLRIICNFTFNNIVLYRRPCPVIYWYKTSS